MSHTVEIKTEIKNIECLKRAFEHLGWTIKDHSKMRTYGSDPLREAVYDHVAVNPRGQFDIGVRRMESDYKLFGDTYDRSIEEQLGKGFGKLKQRYSFEVVKEYAEESELEYEVKTLENGTLELVIQ
jgi:hypothetical protein